MTGEEIRSARLKKGWTQSQLASRVQRSQASISVAEKGGPVSSSFLRKLQEVLREEEPYPQTRTAGGSPIPSFSLPQVPLDRDGLTLPISVAQWKRPELSGDSFLLLPLPREALLLVAIDVAGHGLSVLPSSFFLQGWLRGWTLAQGSAPRLQSLVEDFSRHLRSASVDAGCYFALLTRQRNLRHTISYEAVSYGFPPPLLITGPPFETPQSASLGPPLPSDDLLLPTVRIDKLSAPWRLALASDGLLSRLGDGRERQGLRHLLEWQSGPRRDESPARHLDTPLPVTDDESFLLLQWDSWDSEVSFPVDDDEERHRTLRTLGQRVGQVLGPGRGIALQQVLVEAFDNVRRHAYAGRNGLVKVRFREEEQRFRVEVEDEGRDRVTDAKVRASRSGFAVMRRGIDSLEVRPGPRDGTIVSLVLEKERKTGA